MQVASSVAVSYTHLKLRAQPGKQQQRSRQQRKSGTARRLHRRQQVGLVHHVQKVGLIPVSYTHLIAFHIICGQKDNSGIGAALFYLPAEVKTVPVRQIYIQHNQVIVLLRQETTGH